jgi:integrase
MNIAPYGKGYRVQVYKNGVRKSSTFTTKTEARAWGQKTEAELSIQRHGGDHTFEEATQKYTKSVSSKKAGKLWEQHKFHSLIEHFGSETKLIDIDAPQIAEWRDTRLETVTASTVIREVNLLRNLFNIARNEWRWIEHEPFRGVKMPKENQPRYQVWTWKLIKRVLRAKRTGKTQEMQDAFHIALRTGMRLGEVLAAPPNFDPVRHVVTIKTKTEARAVIPIGRIASKLLIREPFKVNANEGSTLFSKLCKELLITGLTFHDTRGTALTLLSKRVEVLTLAKISRHKNLSLLSNVYYRATPESIAAKI